MKRSEYIKETLAQMRVPGAWFVVTAAAFNDLPAGAHSAKDFAEKLADLREAAGAAWDPEEPVLPDSLIYYHGELLPGRIYPPGKTASVGCWKYPPEQNRENAYVEAVRRYNAWPELEKEAKRAAGGLYANGFQAGRVLLAILRRD